MAKLYTKSLLILIAAEFIRGKYILVQIYHSKGSNINLYKLHSRDLKLGARLNFCKNEASEKASECRYW